MKLDTPVHGTANRPMLAIAARLGGAAGRGRQRTAVGLVSIHEAHRDGDGDRDRPGLGQAVKGKFTGSAGTGCGTSPHKGRSC